MIKIDFHNNDDLGIFILCWIILYFSLIIKYASTLTNNDNISIFTTLSLIILTFSLFVYSILNNNLVNYFSLIILMIITNLTFKPFINALVNLTNLTNNTIQIDTNIELKEISAKNRLESKVNKVDKVDKVNKVNKVDKVNKVNKVDKSIETTVIGSNSDSDSDINNISKIFLVI